MMEHKKLFIALLIVSIVFISGCGQKTENNQQTQPSNITMTATSRSFYMGLGTLPPDLTPQAISSMYAFVNTHGDIMFFHFDQGIPWQEALESKEFPKSVTDDWSSRLSNKSADKEIYLAITPLSFLRDGLATYKTETGEESRQPWNAYRLNDENVKKAYLNYAKRIVDYFRPKYLAIGIESNMLLSRDIQKWNDYKELNEFVYKELKKSYPNIVIFNTIQYEYMRGLAIDSEKNLDRQVTEVRELMKNSDILALSTYHYGREYSTISSSYFDAALQFGKPLAVSEFGSNAMDAAFFGRSYHADESLQKQFVEMILSEASENNFVFVMYFIPMDFDKLTQYWPQSMQEFAKAWVHMGLQDANGKARPALAVWDSYRNLPRR